MYRRHRNIYADESLYEAGISPFREARTINNKELKRLKNSIKEKRAT